LAGASYRGRTSKLVSGTDFNPMRLQLQILVVEGGMDCVLVRSKDYLLEEKSLMVGPEIVSFRAIDYFQGLMI
jgi:hypothetical protein